MLVMDAGVGGGKKTTTTTSTKKTTTTPAKTTTAKTGTVSTAKTGSTNTSTAKKTTTYVAPSNSQQYKEAQQEKFVQKSVDAGKVVNNSTARALGYNNYQDYLQTQKLRAMGLNETNNWGQPTDTKNAGVKNNTQANTISNLVRGGYYNELLDYFKDRNEEARNSAISAIMQRLNTLKGMYGTQMDDLDEEYQNLINQNEVQRYKSKGAIREALANRGQLDSGLGRQEQLYLDTKYGNQTSNLKAQKQKAKQDIQNLINQAIAEAEADKAETNNAYNNALLQYELANA